MQFSVGLAVPVLVHWQLERSARRHFLQRRQLAAPSSAEGNLFDGFLQAEYSISLIHAIFVVFIATWQMVRTSAAG